MKCLFWNVRGLANNPSRLALKKLIISHKPELCFIASKLSARWLSKLNLKLFCVNTRDNLIPNLWCLCSTALNPSLIFVDDQHISIKVEVDGKVFGISAIYASTCYIRRRNLWSAISNTQNLNLIPWCYIGDFNTIIGAHEQRSRFTPARIPIEDFQNWTNNCNLMHLPTRGASHTWSNGRQGRNNTQRRLDRAVCNHDFINNCCNVSCSTLTKIRSDHFPLLLEFRTQNIQFASSFKFMKMWISHPDCRNVIEQAWNINVVGCPMYILSQKLKMLKEKLKVWNKETFGDIHLQVKNATAQLDAIQAEINRDGHTDMLMEQEKLAQINLENVLNMEECFWQEKAKVKWHAEGDRNTAYFHKIGKIKNTTSLITNLMNGDELLTNQE